LDKGRKGPTGSDTKRWEYLTKNNAAAIIV
jgi:hypothetical protein